MASPLLLGGLVVLVGSAVASEIDRFFAESTAMRGEHGRQRGHKARQPHRGASEGRGRRSWALHLRERPRRSVSKLFGWHLERESSGGRS